MAERTSPADKWREQHQRGERSAVRSNWKSKGKDAKGRGPKGERVQEKDATLVLKNIPKTFESSSLVESLNEYEIEPDTIMYHYDVEGKFSGIAMVKYPSIDEASEMMDKLSKFTIDDNPIRVEYRRKRFDETEEYQQYYEQIYQFKEDTAINEISFDATLTPFQRKLVHQIATKLNLSHESKLDGNDRYIIVSKKPRGAEKRGYNFARRAEAHKPTGRKEPQIRPIRQPTGPDGTIGFSTEFQENRKVELRARGKLSQKVLVTHVDGEPVDLSG